METMADESKRFVEEFANPHSWLMMADNLREQAMEIYKDRIGSSIIKKVNASRKIVQQTRGIDKSVFLLSGFALENAIKAFLVYENLTWVSNGRLSGKLKSHSLTGLQKLSKNIPYKKLHPCLRSIRVRAGFLVSLPLCSHYRRYEGRRSPLRSPLGRLQQRDARLRQKVGDTSG
jgi:hypothetical protein